jgi:hypothetical protein
MITLSRTPLPPKGDVICTQCVGFSPLGEKRGKGKRNISFLAVTKYFHTKVFVVCVILFLKFGLTAYSQELDLNQLVNVKFTNEKLESVLNTISKTYNIRFSYSSRNIPVDFKVSYSATNKPLNQVLLDIFKQAGISFENVNGFLILKPTAIEEPKSVQEKISYFTISGTICDSSNSENLIGAAIYIKENGIGTLTNSYGFYSIKLPKGNYTLETSYIGYSMESIAIELNHDVKQNLRLSPIVSIMDEIIVYSEDKEQLITNSRASQYNLKPYEVKKQPAAMGETDMLKSLDNLPGISFQGDGSSYFSVRGGGRDQNLVLLDEATIYNPNHLLGFFTPIIPEAVKNADIYKADFPIEYGGRLSSIIDIRTRDGNMQKISGNLSTDPVSTRISIEGPIKKDTSSYFVSFRRSQFGILARKLNPSISDFFFRDFTAKFNFKLKQKDRIFLTLFSGRDVFIVKPQDTKFGLRWGNNSMTLRWNHVFGDELFLNTTFYTSKYDYSFYTNFDKDTKWNSHISSNTLKSEFTWFLNPQNKIKYGFSVGGYFFNPGNYNAENTPDNLRVSKVNSTEVVVYAGNEQDLTPWLRLNYGVRISKWADLGEAFVIDYDNNYQPVDTSFYSKSQRYYTNSSVEPRISASVKTGKYQSIKASYTRTSQNINQINNSISPFNSFEVWLPSGPNIKPQKADIYDVGYRIFFPGKSIELMTDVYYKEMFNQISYTPHAQMFLNPYLEGELRQGNTQCWGFELLLKKTQGKLTGQISYAYNQSRFRLNSSDEYPSVYDKPVDFSMALDYKLKPRWSLNVNWTYYSGMIITAPTGFYNYRGSQVPYYSEVNNDRFPDYKRFDIGSVWRLNKLEGNFEHYLTFTLYNFFNAQNYASLNFNKTVGADGKFYVPADNLNPSKEVVTYRYIYSVVPSITYNLKF